MAVKFANNVSTTLSAAINATQTTISVADASGLPTLSSGDYVYLTIDTDTTTPTIEVVKVTAVSSNDLTVVRGQDGTTASSFSNGTKVELRVTAAALDDISSAADTESVSIDGDTMTGDLSGTNISLSGSITATRLIDADNSNAYLDPNGASVLLGSLLSKGHSSGDNWMPYTDGNFYIRAPLTIFDNNVRFADGSGILEFSGDNSGNHYLNANSGQIRIRPNGTTTNKIVLDSAYINAPAYQVGGTEVIDSSRNLTNIGTVSSGNVSVTGTLAVSSTSNLASVNGTYFSDGYVTWNAAQFNRSGANIEFQWSPSNSSAGVRIGGNTSNPIVFDAYNGTINNVNIAQGGSLQLDSGTMINSSRHLQTLVRFTTNDWFRSSDSVPRFYFENNGATYIRAASDWYLQNNSGANVFKFTSTGVVQHNGTQILDASRNLTNIGSVTATGLGINESSRLSPVHVTVTSSQTALTLQNTGGGGGSHVALDFVNYDDGTGYANPSARISAVDDGSHGGNVTFYGKASGIAGALSTIMTVKAKGDVEVNSGDLDIKSGDLELNGIARITNAGNATLGGISANSGSTLTLSGNANYGVTLNHGDTGTNVNADALSIRRTSTTGTKRAQIGLITNDTDGLHHRGHIYANRDTVDYGGKIVIRVRSSASGYDDAIIARYNGDVEFPNGDLKMGSTTFIDSSRNITNIVNFTNTHLITNRRTSAFSPNDSSAGLRLEYSGGDAAGDIGSGIVFAQRWYSGSTNNVRTGGIAGFKGAGNGAFGGGLKFYTQPQSGADMNLALTLDRNKNASFEGSVTASDDIVTTDSGGTNKVTLSRFTGVTFRGNGSGSRSLGTTSNDVLNLIQNNQTRMVLQTNGDVLVSNGLTVTGNLTVNGTTTTIDTTNLNVEDNNITLNYSTGDSSATANGAGITIQDAVNSTTDATLTWDATNDEWDFSHGVSINGHLLASSLGAFGNATLDPDAYGSYAGGFGTIADGSGWVARGVFIHGGGTGDAAAIGHNGNHLYFGIQNGSSANSMDTWLEVTPAKVANFAAQVNVSGHGNSSQWNTAYGWGDHSTQGYITNATASLNADKITAGVLNYARIPIPANGDWWNNGYVRVQTDGVMEVGKYLDFHTSDSGGSTDFDVRVTATPGAIDIDGDLTVDDITASDITTNGITTTGVLTVDTSPAGNGTGDLKIIHTLNSASGVGYAGQVIGVNIEDSINTSNQPEQNSTWGGVTGATAIALQADDNSYGQFQVWTSPQSSSAGTALTPRFWIDGIGDATFSRNIKINGTTVIDSNRNLTNIVGLYGNSGTLNHYNTNHYFKDTASNLQVHINNTGVGIGIDNPSSALDIRGAGSGGSQKNTIAFGNSGWGAPLAPNAALDGGVKLALFEGSTQKVQIGMDGNARLWLASAGSGAQGVDIYTGSSNTAAPSLRFRVDQAGTTNIYGSLSTTAISASSSITTTDQLIAETDVIVGESGGAAYGALSDGQLYFSDDDLSDKLAYSIGLKRLENINGNYTKLNIDWHTGITLGAASGYGGVRFFNNSVGHYNSTTKLFSVGEGDAHVRVYNDLKMGSTTVINASRAITNITGISGTGNWETGGFIRSTSSADATGLGLRSTNEVLSGEGWCTALYNYNNNDGFLVVRRDGSGNAYPHMHVSGYNNPGYAGYTDGDGMVTITRSTNAKNAGSSTAGTALTTGPDWSRWVKTSTATVFQDADNQHEFKGNIQAGISSSNGNRFNIKVLGYDASVAYDVAMKTHYDSVYGRAGQIATTNAGLELNTEQSNGRIVIKSGSGMVGINNDTPQRKLTVTEGSAGGAGDNSGILSLTVGSGANTDSKLAFGIDSSHQGWIHVVKPGTNVYPLVLNPTNSTNGRVGIGRSPTSTYHLDVNGNTLINGILNISSSGAYRVSGTTVIDSSRNLQNINNAFVQSLLGVNDTNTYINFAGSDQTRFYQGGQERVQINGTGLQLHTGTSIYRSNRTLYNSSGTAANTVQYIKLYDRGSQTSGSADLRFRLHSFNHSEYSVDVKIHIPTYSGFLSNYGTSDAGQGIEVEITCGGLSSQTNVFKEIIEVANMGSSSDNTEIWLKIQPPHATTRIDIAEQVDSTHTLIPSGDGTGWTTTAPSNQQRVFPIKVGKTVNHLHVDRTSKITLGGDNTNSTNVLSSVSNPSSSGGVGSGNRLRLEFMEPSYPNYGAQYMDFGVRGGGYVDMRPSSGGLFIYSPYSDNDQIHVGYSGIQLFNSHGGYTQTNDLVMRSVNGFAFQQNNGNNWFRISSSGTLERGSSNTAVLTQAGDFQNVTASAGSAGFKFAANNWFQDSGNSQRFYFEGSGKTFFGSGNGYIFRDSSDVGRATISNSGGINLASGGDGQVGSTVALAVGGTTVLDTSRNMSNVNLVKFRTESSSFYQSDINPNTLNGQYNSTSDAADMWINYRGYANGFTHFRDFRVGNGKGTALIFVDGSAATMNLEGGCALQVGGTTVINSSRDLTPTQINLPSRNGSLGMSLNDGSVNFRTGTDHYHKMWYFDGLCFATNYSHGHFRFYAETNTQRNNSTGGHTLVFDIDAQNQTVTASGNITAYSDIKLKDDIQPIENALDKVCAIRGVTFTRKDHQDKTKRHMGVIAQEVEAAGLNEVVEYNEEKDVKTVSYGNMVGVLIEAMKEQQQTIDSLTKRIEELENGDN